MRKVIRKHVKNFKSFEKLFAGLDKDGSGSIDRAELSVLLKTILGKTKLPSNGLQVDLEKGKLPLPDWHSFAVTHNSLIDPDGFYVVGGKSKGVWQNKAYRFNVVSESWESLPPMKTARRRTATALVMGI